MLVHQTNAALPAPSSPALGTHCAQVGKHHVVDCGQDVFSVSTSNWGKTRMMAHNLLHRTDLGYLKVGSDQPCSLRRWALSDRTHWAGKASGAPGLLVGGPAMRPAQLVSNRLSSATTARCVS